MNIGNVLFSPNGRIGQQDYWIGILILIGGNIVAQFIPILGALIWLGLIWVGIAVYGKRLHDSGKTAWIHLLPWALSTVLAFVGIAIMVASAISAGVISETSADFSVEQIIALVSAGGIGLLLLGLSSLVWVIYTIWVGVMAGDPGENRFGPAPGADAATAANVAAASGAAGAAPTAETASPAPTQAPEPPAAPPAETPEAPAEPPAEAPDGDGQEPPKS
jgi:uncharacterized membrane protein YhaH (DUF805 family)